MAKAAKRYRMVRRATWVRVVGWLLCAIGVGAIVADGVGLGLGAIEGSTVTFVRMAISAGIVVWGWKLTKAMRPTPVPPKAQGGAGE